MLSLNLPPVPVGSKSSKTIAPSKFSLFTLTYLLPLAGNPLPLFGPNAEFGPPFDPAG
jgi:hypothetical protein